MESSKKKTYIFLFIILILMIGIGIFFLKRYFNANTTPNTSGSVNYITDKNPQDIAEILKNDPADILHIKNIILIEIALNKYFKDRNIYPKKIENLRPFYLKVIPRQSSEEDYLYAYYPGNNPTQYHLGAKLGGNNPADAEAFKKDSDFNSQQTYINGFDGTDPIFDIHQFMKK